jgi:uncharacterized protein YraI
MNLSHRVLAGVLALILPAAAWAADLYTKRANSQLREGPGAFYPVVANLPVNTKVKGLEEKERWLRVQVGAQTGWLAAASLDEKRQSGAVESMSKEWGDVRASRGTVGAAVKGFAGRIKNVPSGALDDFAKRMVPIFTPDEFWAFRSPLVPFRTRTSIDTAQDREVNKLTYDVTPREFAVGMAVAARIASAGLVRDWALHKYVNLIAADLISEAALTEWGFGVYILDNPGVDSYAVPGGFIFLSRGAIESARDEAELAGLIAHEVIHIVRRHGLREMKAQAVRLRADQAMDELDQETGRDDVEDDMEEFAEEAFAVVHKPRLEKYEIEADQIGTLLLRRAGYDPRGMARLLTRMSATHPELNATPRVARIERFAGGPSGTNLIDRFTAQTRRRR